MMKLLLDQGLPRSAASILRKQGIDVIHVGEIQGSKWSDAEIIQKGRDQGHVIVTLDADFHMLLALSGASSPSVIRVRIEGLRAQPIAQLIQAVLERCTSDLHKGAVVTVQEGRLRVRLLPLVS